MKLCLECWDYQPIERKCLKTGEKVEPMQPACDDFTSTV